MPFQFASTHPFPRKVILLGAWACFHKKIRNEWHHFYNSDATHTIIIQWQDGYTKWSSLSFHQINSFTRLLLAQGCNTRHLPMLCSRTRKVFNGKGNFLLNYIAIPAPIKRRKDPEKTSEIKRILLLGESRIHDRRWVISHKKIALISLV